MDFDYYIDPDMSIDDYETYNETDIEIDDDNGVINDHDISDDNADTNLDDDGPTSLTSTEVKSPDGKFKVDVGVYASGTKVRKSPGEDGIVFYSFCYDYEAADGLDSDEYSGLSCEGGEFELFIIESMDKNNYNILKSSPYGEIYKTIGSYGPQGVENYVLMWANGDLSSMLEGIGENYFEEVADSFVYLD